MLSFGAVIFFWGWGGEGFLSEINVPKWGCFEPFFPGVWFYRSRKLLACCNMTLLLSHNSLTFL